MGKECVSRPCIPHLPPDRHSFPNLFNRMKAAETDTKCHNPGQFKIFFGGDRQNAAESRQNRGRTARAWCTSGRSTPIPPSVPLSAHSGVHPFPPLSAAGDGAVCCAEAAHRQNGGRRMAEAWQKRGRMGSAALEGHLLLLSFTPRFSAFTSLFRPARFFLSSSSNAVRRPPRTPGACASTAPRTPPAPTPAAAPPSARVFLYSVAGGPACWMRGWVVATGGVS